MILVSRCGRFSTATERPHNASIPPLLSHSTTCSPPRQVQAFLGQAGGGGGHGGGAGEEHGDVRRGELSAREKRSASQVLVQARQVLLRKRGREVQPGVNLTGDGVWDESCIGVRPGRGREGGSEGER